ncbi:hypothetical protein EDB85DRAFT_2220184 [Lactarius pseudohatsudake]|nr:hypothetical protein EDB85DRAFT_2220184 [Lactarius pseudohatsudake]
MVPHPETMPTASPIPDTLAEAWDVVKDRPNHSNKSRTLDAVEDTVATAQSNVAPFQPLITATKDAVEQTDLGEAVKERIGTLFEGMPIFMKALDVAADLHPVIRVVVVAFKTAYTLELKRRDNEKKIPALYVEMKDMMSVLLPLKDVQNNKLIAPDGRNIEDRMKSLVERTANDIKQCSNMCDAYSKKKLLAKVFQCSVWDTKLANWMVHFSKRRKEFVAELSFHTSQGVDKANAKLDVIGDTTRALYEKINVLTAMFEQLVSPEEKRLNELVRAKGGPKEALRNDKELLSLEKEASKASSAPGSEWLRVTVTREKPSDANTNANDLNDLRKDIVEDPDIAVKKNENVHSRKFAAQMSQITVDVTSVVKQESDRVIQEMKGGPHDRIRDRTIHEIWTEMGWRGNVKARHFVLALRDYYLEGLAAEAEGVPGTGSAINSTQNPDAWAIKFVDVTRLQPISEAFDDDASGFITISEMNRFTRSRPEGWSLPHWVAFWAVGYRESIIDYAIKIEMLFSKMEGIRAVVLPRNRQSVDHYFASCWYFVHSLTAAIRPLFEPGSSNRDKFKSYLEAEEARLSARLEAVDYTIDGMDTLELISGVGRIEKTVFPLIYLLMKRHYEIMRAMRTKMLDELQYGADSLFSVNAAIQYRINDLTSISSPVSLADSISLTWSMHADIFSHQKLDPEKQFQNFAYGIFKYFYSGKDLWSSNYIRSLDPLVTPYDDSNEDQNVKLEDILKHEHKDELALNDSDWVYDGHSIDDTPNYPDVEPPLKDILGHWHGYFYEDDGIRETSGTDSMMTFVLEPADGEREFKARAWSNRGCYTITGSWSKGENDVTEIKLTMKFPTIIWAEIFFNGRFDAERDALTGVWGLSADTENSGGPMEFRRIPPRYLTVYPSIKELSDNKPRALWGFAIAAVRNDTVISLATRYLYFGELLNDEEIRRCCATSQRLTSADACFYSSRIDQIRAITWVHENTCDRCGGLIGGARLFCLDCDQKGGEFFNTLDLCCAQECMVARITHRQDLEVPHEPSHRLIKVRTVVHYRQHGRVQTAALAAFERVQPLCAKIAESSQQIVEEGEETGTNTKNPSSPKPTSEETPSELGDDKPCDDPDVPVDTAVEVEDVGDTSQDPNAETSQGRTQPPDSDLPSCGKCMGRLSFPCWYCIKCEDDLFLCDSCDREGVPERVRGSGKHTEDHHLVRCLAPEKEDDTLPSTERRLISLEIQLNNMHYRFDDMQSRFDDLTRDLTSRIGNMEQLLHRLAAAATAGSSA